MNSVDTNLAEQIKKIQENNINLQDELKKLNQNDINELATELSISSGKDRQINMMLLQETIKDIINNGSETENLLSCPKRVQDAVINNINFYNKGFIDGVTEVIKHGRYYESLLYDRKN